MGSRQLLTLTLAIIYVRLCFSARISFEKCAWKGFECQNAKEIPNKLDITFNCNTTLTGQDVTLYLWQFNAPGNINSFTIQNCHTVHVSFTCTAENKPIQWLKVSNASYLEIMPALITHNPPKVYFENIKKIDNIPRHAFSQIKKQALKPGCFVPVNDLDEVHFDNVNINTVETEAFYNLTEMKNFSWNNVSAIRLMVNAITLDFHDGGRGKMTNNNIEMIDPMALRIVGNGFSITESQIGDMAGSAINGTIYYFEFNNNTVLNIQSGALSVLARNVYMMDNHFKNIQSGAFQRVGPGLLHDSLRNFGKLIFVYKFSNNLIESVDDGGIRPDITAYKNVASQVTFTYNTLQCSCEGITWLGADVDLGYGYSVLKDFNTMILDPQNSNICTFTPCMCFGVRSPNKKGSPTAAVF